MFRNTLMVFAAVAAGGACAQSSVTISGVVDVGVSHGSGSIAGNNLVTSGNNSTSRLILRGQEDLGGKLAASFWLEGQFSADSGVGANTNTNNQTTGAAGGGGLTFNRRASIALSGPMGEVRLGRDAAAHFYNRWETDPFVAIGAGATQAFVGSIGGPASIRVSNAVSYFLPGGLGGAFGQVQYYLGENPGNAANRKDGTGLSVRLGYAAKAIKISVNHARTPYLAGDISSYALAGTYNMTVMRVMAGLFRDRVAPPGNNTGKGYTLGVVVPVGSGDLKFALSRYGTSAGLKPETTKLALGYVHNLSKRTALYATYARVRNSGGAARAINGAVTAPNAGSSGLDVGIRHFF